VLQYRHPVVRSSIVVGRSYACSRAEKYCWEFGGQISSHLIRQFPHERIANDRNSLRVHPQNDLRMRSVDDYCKP